MQLVNLLPLTWQVLHPSNQVVQPGFTQLPHLSQVVGHLGLHLPGASEIIGFVLTHWRPGMQRVWYCGGVSAAKTPPVKTVSTGPKLRGVSPSVACPRHMNTGVMCAH